MSGQLLTISTLCLGKLFQYFTRLTHFLCSDGISYFLILSIASCYWEEPGFLFYVVLYHLFCTLITSLALQFSRLNSSSFLSFSSQYRCSHPVIIFVAFHWTLSSISMSLLYQGDHNRNQSLACFLACWVEGIDHWSIDQLAALLMQPRMLLVFFDITMQFWPTDSLSSTMIPNSFSVELLSSWWPQPDSQMQKFAFVSLELFKVPVSPVLQPVEVPPDHSTTLCCIIHSSQICFIY